MKRHRKPGRNRETTSISALWPSPKPREKEKPPCWLPLGLELNLIKAPAENLNIHYLSYFSKEPALQQVTKLAPTGSSADDLPNDRDVLKSIDLSG